MEGTHGASTPAKPPVATVLPVSAGLTGPRSAVTVRREWCEKKNPQQSKTHTRFFLSSLRAEQKYRAATGVRGHWSIENRNHHKRDASLWQEDRHPHRRPNAALNFALTRNALLAIIPFKEGMPLARFFDLHRRRPAVALHLILNTPPQL